MSSLSSSKQSEVKAWEEEITPCEHTLCLQQDAPRKLEQQTLAHCANCDLKENLWLCLTCGNLGCGRRQFDGSGGNNHALEHFEATGHGVSCKLGTITPEGTAGKLHLLKNHVESFYLYDIYQIFTVIFAMIPSLIMICRLTWPTGVSMCLSNSRLKRA